MRVVRELKHGTRKLFLFKSQEQSILFFDKLCRSSSSIVLCRICNDM
jgi:hypothetical protein